MASLFFAVRKSFLLLRLFLILRFSSIVFSWVNCGMILSGNDKIVASEPFPWNLCTKICVCVCTTAVHNSRSSLKNLSPRFKSLADGAISRCEARNCLATMHEILSFLSNFPVVRQQTGLVQRTLLTHSQTTAWVAKCKFCLLQAGQIWSWFIDQEGKKLSCVHYNIKSRKLSLISVSQLSHTSRKNTAPCIHCCSIKISSPEPVSLFIYPNNELCLTCGCCKYLTYQIIYEIILNKAWPYMYTVV